MPSAYPPPEGNDPSYQPGPQPYPEQYGSVPGGPQPQPAPPTRGRKGPLAMLIAGLACGVVSVILILIGAGVGVGGAVAAGQEQVLLEPGTPHTLDVEADMEYGIYLDGPSEVRCYAENQNDEPVEIEAPGANVTVNNRNRVLVITTGPGDTELNLVCETDTGGDFFFGENFGDKLGGMVIPIAIGAIVGFFAFPLTIGGIIWLVVRNREIKRAREGAYPGG